MRHLPYYAVLDRIVVNVINMALAIFVIASGYPFSSPLELNPAGGSDSTDGDNPFAYIESVDESQGLCCLTTPPLQFSQRQ